MYVRKKRAKHRMASASVEVADTIRVIFPDLLFTSSSDEATYVSLLQQAINSATGTPETRGVHGAQQCPHQPRIRPAYMREPQKKNLQWP